MTRRRYVVTAALVCTAALAAACGGSKGEASLPLLDPAATGTLSEHGGATRAGDDRSALIADSIENTGARNVILLIGDGMGIRRSPWPAIMRMVPPARSRVWTLFR